MAGVYAIIHNPSGRAYVGSAKCIRTRWHRHAWSLSRGNHHAGELMALWQRDGASAFLFVALEHCAAAVRFVREQAWLDSFENPLNTTRFVEQVSHDPEIAKRIGDTQRGKKKKPHGDPANASRAQTMLWTSPAVRARRIAGILKRITPEDRQRRSLAAKRQWDQRRSDPAAMQRFRDRARDGVESFWASSDNAARQAEIRAVLSATMKRTNDARRPVLR